MDGPHEVSALSYICFSHVFAQKSFIAVGSHVRNARSNVFFKSSICSSPTFVAFSIYSTRAWNRRVPNWSRIVFFFLLLILTGKSIRHTSQPFYSNGRNITKGRYIVWRGHRKATWSQPAQMIKRWSWCATMTYKNNWKAKKRSSQCTMVPYVIYASWKIARTRRVCWSVAVRAIAKFMWPIVQHRHHFKRSAVTADIYWHCTIGVVQCLYPAHR